MRAGRALVLAVLALGGCAAPGGRAPGPGAAPPGTLAPLAAAPSPAGPAAAPGASGAPGALRTPEFVAVAVRPGESLESLAVQWLGDPERAWEIAEYNGVATAAPGQELAIPLKPFRLGGLTPARYQTVPVLVYHQFGEKSANKMIVSREAFEAQMQLLREKGYRVIPLAQLLAFAELRGQIPERSVVITIDDGWRTMYDVAFPILKKYGYPATLFVYTQLITGGAKTLSWEQVQEMATQGIDVQCHTVSHRNLALQQEGEDAEQYFAEVRREISDATRIIEQKTGRRPTVLAYPYGETNGLAIELLRRQGYRAALTVVREANPFFTPAFRLGRAMVYGDYDLARFEKNLVVSDRKALR
ncbi:MAG TPA: polysaccharide deacetylase family protein [Candidatus Methanoperedens sp.]|nr:polysaccharide deacetylase family protein [Candidatus Methanoperedens sp.]